MSISMKQLARSARWMLPLAFRGPRSRFSAADLIERRAASRGNAVFVRFEGRERSYRAYNRAANRVANWALGQGFGRGDVVALIMQNRPEYLEIWAGLAKVGVTTALVNIALRGGALAHALDAAGTRHVIVGAECLAAWESLAREALADVRLFVARDPCQPAPGTLPVGAASLDEETAPCDDANPPRSVRAGLRGGDPLFYIYTSGTTGLPKAARFSHARWVGGGMYALLAGFGRNDVMYCPLPLYHTVAGVMAVNAVLSAGGTLALARRFRASRFWDEIVTMRATAFQYVGELPRYLLDQPERETERGHAVRFCVGNGLRPEVWERFRDRFGIPHIVEFYGATESNVSMVNLDDRVGSVGRPAPGMQAELVRYDVARGEHVRDQDGKLALCGADEVGELIGRISKGRTVAGTFEGYTSKEASAKKILHDVVKPGDAWFRSGDLMRRDADGHYYFVDRIGDTFRWKGENVSAQQVADAVGEFAGVELCAAYGVRIPGADGRVGMVALRTHDDEVVDGGQLFAHVERALPAYARPAFVRVLDAPDLTATFKIRKVALQREGYDARAIADPVLYRDDERRAYLPLSPEVADRIRDGEVRF
jgi:fatty-acyl-CoA synthase